MKAPIGASLLALLALLALSPATAGQSPTQDEELASPRLRVSWDEFKKLYDAGKIEVVDVRGRDSFRAGHIPGARSIPLDEVEKRAGELRKSKKPIVTYCS